MAGRRTTPLFGLGLVGAVPDQTFEQLANLEQQYAPATAGRVNMVTDQATGEQIAGRFGWKCQQGSLFSFSGDAYLNEMGITTPLVTPTKTSPRIRIKVALRNPRSWRPTRVRLTH